MNWRNNFIAYIFGDSRTRLTKTKSTDVEKIISDLFEYELNGKKIKDSNGKYYTVYKCVCTYSSVDRDIEQDFYSVDVYLKDYNADFYFLYDDDVFVKNLATHLPYFYITYSEPGMQGDNYVNLDVMWPQRR